MRIAFVSHEGNPVKSGGVTLLNDLVTQFQKLNFSVATYLPKFRNCESNENETIRRLKVTRKSASGITSFELLKLFSFGILSLRRQLKKDQITHIYSIFAFPSGFLVYLATIGMQLNRIVIVDAIDLPGVENSPVRSSKLLRFAIRNTLKSSSRVLVIQGLEVEFESFCELEYTSVSTGIDSPMDLVRQPHLQREFRILTIARLVKRKNLPLTLNILKALIESGIPARLIVIGDGPEMLTVERMIRSLELTGIVELKGFINLENIPEILMESDAYLFTGFNEGISIALLQALSYGLPTVVKQNEGNKIIFGKRGEVFALDSNDPSDFAQVLSRIFHEREFRKFAEEVSLEIVEPYLWETAIKRYLPNEIMKG